MIRYTYFHFSFATSDKKKSEKQPLLYTCLSTNNGLFSWRTNASTGLNQLSRVLLPPVVHDYLGQSDIVCVSMKLIPMAIKRETANNAPHTRKRKCRFYEIFVTGCTWSCQIDNLRSGRWWKFRRDKVFVEMMAYRCLWTTRLYGLDVIFVLV